MLVVRLLNVGRTHFHPSNTRAAGARLTIFAYALCMEMTKPTGWQQALERSFAWQEEGSPLRWRPSLVRRDVVGLVEYLLPLLMQGVYSKAPDVVRYSIPALKHVS